MKYPQSFINKVICGDCLEVMKAIPDGSVDLVITDPPYGLSYFSNYYKHGNPHQKIIGDSDLLFPIDELWRILKPSGAIFSFHSHKKPIQDVRLKNNIIWVKNNWSAGDLEGDFGNQYELIAFLPKEDFKLKEKRYSNVWHFARQEPILHPTQKPIDLIIRIIRCGSNPGGIILDPFFGSGTTVEACKLLHRNFIGIEINPDYCKIAEERLAQGVLP